MLTVTAGTVTATSTYVSGLLTRVDYSNGTALTNITRNAAGAGTGFTWDFASGDDVTDSVVRSQSGRIVQNTLTDGAVVQTSTYSFDAAGRLVLALIPRHQQFDPSGVKTTTELEGRISSSLCVQLHAAKVEPKKYAAAAKSAVVKWAWRTARESEIAAATSSTDRLSSARSGVHIS